MPRARLGGRHWPYRLACRCAGSLAGFRKLVAEKASPSVAAAFRVQFGGFASGKVAGGLSEQPDIGSFLLGGASL